MNTIKKLIFVSIIAFFFQNIAYTDTPYFLDFKYILNESIAGKKSSKLFKKQIRKRH